MDLKEVKSLIEDAGLSAVGKERFNEAAQRAKDLKSLNQDQQMLLYGLYKQSTVGNINTPQPHAINFTDSIKWKAWKKFESLPLETAMTAYVYVVDQLLAGKPIKPVPGSSMAKAIDGSTKSVATTSSSVTQSNRSLANVPSAPVKVDQPCPFDSSIHLKTADPTPEQRELIKQFRQMLSTVPLASKHSEWADDTQLMRFLIARNFVIKDSFELMKVALKWREFRKPSDIENGPNFPANMRLESETGKIYCPGNDRWGRSVVVLDNTVQNTNSIDDQMTFLAWNLEFAIKEMPPNVDKYLVFMHLGDFSFFNTPPLASTKETIHMVCSCYPERLGHCIAYQPPSVFRLFFNTVKGFLDAKTASKMVFIIGDVSDGSENDKKMRELIGDNWKVLTGAEQPVLRKNTSPGYNHSEHWPKIMKKIEQRSKKESEKEPTSSYEKLTETQPRKVESTKINNEYSNQEALSRGSAGEGKVLEVETSKSTSARGMQSIASREDINNLLSDLFYFVTIVGLFVLMYEWSKYSGSSGGISK